MTKGKRNAVIVMSVAVLLLVSMAVSAGIVGTDKILSFLGGKKPGTTEVTGDDGSNVQFVTSRPAKLSAISSERTSSVFRPLPIQRQTPI